jgi:predicted HNH restriction endonuclease
MKKSLILLIGIIMLISCSKKSKKEIAQQNIKKELLLSLSNADSYEFVSMTDFDTLTVGSFLKEEIGINNLNLKLGEDILSKKEKLLKLTKELTNNKSEVLNAENNLKKENEYYSKIKNTNDSLNRLLKKSNSKSVKYIKTNFKVRVNNTLEGKTINSYRVRLDKDLNVILLKKLD